MSTLKKSYLVEGMTCSGCERTVQSVVTKLEGVTGAQASANESTVSIEYDSDRVSIDQIKSAIDKVGYKFVGERPAGGQREGRDDAVS